LALAVIAIACSLEDAGGADSGDRGGEILRAFNPCIGGWYSAKIGDEAFFSKPILRHLQRARRAGEQWLGDGSYSGERDVFELPRHHIAAVGEIGERCGIVPIGGDEGAAGIGRDIIAIGRVADYPITQLQRGHSQHPAQLAAAENADG